MRCYLSAFIGIIVAWEWEKVMTATTAETSYNPDFTPTGIEGGLDTNALPWLAWPGLDGVFFKPLRASNESGAFSLILQITADTVLDQMVALGGLDMLLLSGELTIDGSHLTAQLRPDIWGYVPANVVLERITARTTTELLVNSFGALAQLEKVDTGHQIRQLFTALDMATAAASAGINLVPNTLAECMQERAAPNPADGVPLAMANASNTQFAGSDFSHAHFVDINGLPWIENPGLPDIALKILRISEETGFVSLIVRHNGVAGPHYHLGAADFLVLSGHIGYRAGPPEGYGPGVWFYEPAGARHEATQRIGDHEDLIYTANVYGPVQFDEGPGTPIVAVQSWMQYKEMADAQGVTLVRNTLPGDTSLLAWSPVGQPAQ